TDATAGAGRMPLDHQRLADMSFGNHEIVDIEIVVVLGIGDRRFQTFAYVARDALARKFEFGERGRNLLAANELRQQIELLRTDAQHASNRFRLGVGQRALALLLAHRASPRLTIRRSAAQPPAPPPVRHPPPERLRARREPRRVWLCDPTNGRRTNGSAQTPRTCGRPFPR